MDDDKMIHQPDDDFENEPKELTQEISWSTDLGQVRTNNEDSLAAIKVKLERDLSSVGIYAVADGMGGHDAGEVASQLAIHTAVQEILEKISADQADLPSNYQGWLQSAVALANQMVHDKNLEGSQRQMGTTLVMAAVVGNNVHIVNVGDSRAYIINESGIRQITRDHSYVQMLVENNLISPEEAENHPNRNVLTQAIGADEDVHIDLFEEQLDEDSYLLLCSDGLWGELKDHEIWEIVMNASDTQTASQALVDATNQAGGRDNIAVVLVKLKKKS